MSDIEQKNNWLGDDGELVVPITELGKEYQNIRERMLLLIRALELSRPFLGNFTVTAGKDQNRALIFTHATITKPVLWESEQFTATFLVLSVYGFAHLDLTPYSAGYNYADRDRQSAFTDPDIPTFWNHIYRGTDVYEGGGPLYFYDRIKRAAGGTGELEKVNCTYNKYSQGNAPAFSFREGKRFWSLRGYRDFTFASNPIAYAAGISEFDGKMVAVRQRYQDLQQAKGALEGLTSEVIGMAEQIAQQPLELKTKSEDK